MQKIIQPTAGKGNYNHSPHSCSVSILKTTTSCHKTSSRVVPSSRQNQARSGLPRFISHQPDWLASCNIGLKVISTKRSSPTNRASSAHVIRPLILNCPRALAITCLSHKGQNFVQRTTFKVLPSRKQVCRLSLFNRLAVAQGIPESLL